MAKLKLVKDGYKEAAPTIDPEREMERMVLIAETVAVLLATQKWTPEFYSEMGSRCREVLGHMETAIAICKGK